MQANLRWNFGVNIIDITFITLGLSLISRETVMPVLVSKLTDSNWPLVWCPRCGAWATIYPNCSWPMSPNA